MIKVVIGSGSCGLASGAGEVYAAFERMNDGLCQLGITGLILEDEFWTWQVIARAKRVAILQESYYNYLQRGDSTMGVGFSERRLSVVRAKIERQNYVERVMPNLTDVARTDLVYTCMHLGIQVLKTMHRRDAVRCMKHLNVTVKCYPIGKAYLHTLTWKKRLHLWMLQYLFVPTCWLHSI